MTIKDLAYRTQQRLADATAGSFKRSHVYELLAAAFLKLPARCRTIMTLRKLKGQSVREIAAALDITEGTVDHQITRGTHLLRTYLEEAGVRSFNRD